MKKALIRLGILACMLCAMLLPSYAANVKQLIPVGETVGLDIRTDGVLVVGYSDKLIPTPAEQAGVAPGDVITAIGGIEVESCQDMCDALAGMDGSPVTVELTRGGKSVELTVTPFSGEERCELGVWLRDSIAGIGTVTYYDPGTGSFGSLGHPITDIDTGVIVPISGGEVLESTVTDVVAGSAGSPGQLVGDFGLDGAIGSVISNTEYGVFGSVDIPFDGEPIDVAGEDEVKTGPAKILSNVSGDEVEEYDIEISRIYSGLGGHGMLITVTDQDLLEVTGGIVQGMSGSPIIQDGKLVGAVTHVLINDPSRGYGVFIDNMLGAA